MGGEGLPTTWLVRLCYCSTRIKLLVSVLSGIHSLLRYGWVLQVLLAAHSFRYTVGFSVRFWHVSASDDIWALYAVVSHMLEKKTSDCYMGDTCLTNLYQKLPSMHVTKIVRFDWLQRSKCLKVSVTRTFRRIELCFIGCKFLVQVLLKSSLLKTVAGRLKETHANKRWRNRQIKRWKSVTFKNNETNTTK